MRLERSGRETVFVLFLSALVCSVCGRKSFWHSLDLMVSQPIQQHPLPAVSEIRRVLAADPRVIFAYLYGSYLEDPAQARDVDLAVYSTPEADPFILAADLKMALYRDSGTPADRFDVRIINDLVVKGDLFGLLFLKNLLEKGSLLVDRDREIKGEFLEAYGLKYRSCAGLLGEILA